MSEVEVTLRTSLSKWAGINHSWFFAAKSAKAQLRANFRDFTFRYILVNFSTYLLTRLGLRS